MRSTAARWCVGTLFLAASFASSPASAEIFRWLQYGPDGLEARAITDKPACPAAHIDGAPVTMTVRAGPGEAFAVTVCTLPVAGGVRSVTIDDVPLTLPAAELRRILVIGDTGCRLKGSYIQACNDPVQWPFRLIAEVAAQRKPDLVIHVGDYHYRETPCPAGEAGCAGSPFGDNWAVWRADFFAPAETLLRVAPWVMVRGNHEICERGGHGWSRMLAPGEFGPEPGCREAEKPYVVRLPGLTLAAIDVSPAQEQEVDEAQAAAFHEQYRALSDVTDGPTWILQHRPIWGPGGVFAGKLVGDNKTLEAAALDTLPANVTMILSGHQHLFQVLSYKTGQPVQVVAGHGGDTLDAPMSKDPSTWTFGPVAVETGINVAGRFGFAMLERQEAGWRLTNYDRLGTTSQSCTITGRHATC